MDIKIKIATALTIAVLFVPGISSAQTQSVVQLQQEIASLTAQLTQLEAQLAATGGSTSVWCYTFNTNLSVGASGNDVTQLQTALQKDGESVQITNTFDSQTKAAVIAFQQKYAIQILAPYGLTVGTGNVGVATRTELNTLFGCGITTSTTNLSSAPAQSQTVTANVASQNTATTTPSVTISASPATIVLGQSTTLTWSSKNVASCYTAGYWPGYSSIVTLPANGSQVFTATTGNSLQGPYGVLPAYLSFPISCSYGSGSNDVANAVQVTVVSSTPSLPPPTVSISASPATVTASQPATLTWSSNNASSCTASNAWSGNQSTNGTKSITQSTPGTYTYTIVCAGDGGTSNQVSAAVTVTPVVTTTTPAPTVTISVSPSSVTTGGSETLTWSSTNAVSCVASQSWTGTIATSGAKSISQSTAGTYPYVIQCANSNGVLSAEETAVVQASNPLPPVTISFSPVTLNASAVMNVAGQMLTTLSWTAEPVTTNFMAYEIFRSTTSGFTPSASNEYSQAPAGTLTETYATNNPTGTYYYAVAPEDTSDNFGPASNIVAVSAASAIPWAPSSDASFSPVTLNASAVMNVAGQMLTTLSWTAEPVTTNFMAYEIFRSTTSGFTPSASNEYSQAPAGTLTETYATNNPTGTYYYAVAPEDTSDNFGPASNIVAVSAASASTSSGTAIISSSLQGLLNQLNVLLKSL